MASVEQVPGSEQAAAEAAATAADEVVNTVVEAGARLGVKRHFTIPGRDPFDEIDWETRDALIPGRDGPAFEQRGVEFPRFWSQTATNIVAQKYFRGRLSSPERESSVKQMIGRVVDTAVTWGREGGYFADAEEAETFAAELKAILVNQYASFNSPVWFNVGFEERPQCSACQKYDALISTPDGMVPIGELVEQCEIGREVYDSQGVTRIVAVKHNGRKPVYRVVLRNGQYVEATADHLVKAVRDRRTSPEWLRVDQLRPGMRMHLHPHRAKVSGRVPVLAGAPDDDAPPLDGDPTAIAEAALAGWLQADGFVGQYETGTNTSLTIEFQVAGDDELRWVTDNLDAALPDVHRHVREVRRTDGTLSIRRIRLYGETLRDFVERWGLLARGTDIRAPRHLWTASLDEIVAYLRSVFQADGYVTVRRGGVSESGRVAFAVIGERWTEDIQLLLNVVGIYSRRLRKHEPREDRHDLHEVQISIGSERARFAELIGFVGADKQAKLLESLGLRDSKRCPDLREEEIVSIDPVGVDDVYDIQTESGEYLSNNIAVHNCFILSIDDSMEAILDWIRREGVIFRGGSGSGVNLSRLRSSKEQLSKGGYASGPVSFMRGADASAGTIKSGGKTRRAAKMVVLDVDHPDVAEFIWCKAKEERKARVLEQAGYDMSLDSPDWASIQYQNANNSVRVSDAFMDAAARGEEFSLTARTDGTVLETVEARDLLRQIAAAAWECADPGVQYDTTINSWHTLPNTGRINASNPCFPGDARVHTDRGLLTFSELHGLACIGDVPRVYTHRATAAEPGEGVVASRPTVVMQNAHSAILRLRFSNGQELRCTPNHRLWTLNRGYVRADELEDADRVLLNDVPTPAAEASWELPVRVLVPAVSRVRGGATVEQELPDRWSEGLGELLGHLVGDGCMTDAQTQWIYGGDDIEDGLAASHEGLLRELIGGISRQEMQNGTVQLRAGSEAVRMFFHGLGVTTARAYEKRVPASVFTAPTEVQAAFLRGLFGADGCVSENRIKSSRYAGLGSASEALLRDVQRLLNAFGIRSRIYATSRPSRKFSYTRKDGSTAEYTSRQLFDLRIQGESLERFAEAIGFSTPRKNSTLERILGSSRRYANRRYTTLVAREHDGQQVVYNLNEPLNHSYIVDGIVVANCSEYMSIDDSACNLASLNLMKFRREDGELDVEAFEHAVDVVFLAQEILVGYSSYPTPEIARNAKRFRQLGLGYANLGALLMARGLPYDSDEGRAYAAAITGLMTGRAYRKSAEIAARMGPFDGYQVNRAPMIGVIAKHRAAVGNIEHADSVPADLLGACRKAWDDALDLGEIHGFRNAQATVLAPTGCLVGESLVTTSRGLVRLRSLGDPVGEQWQPLDLEVATNEGPRRATQFYVNGFERVVSVETGRGYRIQGTATHRIKVLDERGEQVWKRFGEIAAGDRVPLLRGGLVGEPQAVELPPLGELHWTADFRTRAPRTMTAELAELVGYFMGDGSLHAKGLRFCVAAEDRDVVGLLTDLGAALFGLDAKATEKGGYTEVALNSVPLALWWEACGFAKLPPSAEHAGKGWHPHIPDAILHTNDPEVYRAFIRGLFETDGTTANGYVSWTTTTESFSRDVQTLLLALGFVTTRKIDTAGSNWGGNDRVVLRLLNVASSERYLAEIDFMSIRKAAALWTGDHRQASRHDHVPVSRHLLDELAPENDALRKTMLMSLARRGDVSRRSATALLERTESAELEQLLGFYYDDVATVEMLDDQPTYDLSVPDNVTYVANGFVSHNTISFMMDCDTTGVEPDFSLVKSKKLVGGGEITIVNKTVPMALERLGYAPGEVEEVVAYLDERNTVVGAPYVKTEHYPIFDCAVGERTIHYLGHVKMMGAVQPFISGAISKCVVAETLISTAEGLVRIGDLHEGEKEDTFRELHLPLASLDGIRETDAFYYGGSRPTIEVVLRSGHRIVGTPNHRVLVASPLEGLDWRRLDEIEDGDHVAVQYGDDLWASRPARLDDFLPTAAYGSQRSITLPAEMSEQLAFLLGAYAAEGHIARSNYTVRIANTDEGVIARLVALADDLFGLRARVTRQPGKCPSVDLSSKTLVEFLDHLGCGDRAATKRIPDAVLRSPRRMVLAFLEGLSLDSYLPTSVCKWAICLASNGLLDDLQAVLTNLGIVHSRITKYNAEYDRSFDEVYAHGRHAQRFVGLLRFPEPHKAVRAAELAETAIGSSSMDVVPGIAGSTLYGLIPPGRSGRTGRGTGHSKQFRHLVDPRTTHVSRGSLEQVAAVPGVELPDWLELVLDRNLHFSPVAAVGDGGEREVYDVSVPGPHAFVGNGIVNHNTVNMPEEVTVEDVMSLYVDAWKLGVKAIAIYRDNCKVAQPLSSSGGQTAVATPPIHVHERKRLPLDRTEVGRKFQVGDHEGYIHVGLYDDGSPGDIFVDIAKDGTTMAGLMNSLCLAVSMGLQYGVPPEVYVSKLSHMRFEPSGLTNDADIRSAKSIVDYIFRWFGKRFLTPEQQEEAGILSPEVKARLAERYAAGGEAKGEPAEPADAPPPGQTALFSSWEDAVECARCGGRMVRTGSCYTCRDCGTNTGCS